MQTLRTHGQPHIHSCHQNVLHPLALVSLIVAGLCQVGFGIYSALTLASDLLRFSYTNAALGMLVAVVNSACLKEEITFPPTAETTNKIWCSLTAFIFRTLLTIASISLLAIEMAAVASTVQLSALPALGFYLAFPLEILLVIKAVCQRPSETLPLLASGLTPTP